MLRLLPPPLLPVPLLAADVEADADGACEEVDGRSGGLVVRSVAVSRAALSVGGGVMEGEIAVATR